MSNPPKKTQETTDYKALWREGAKEAAIERKIEAAKARSLAYDGPESVEEALATSDWERLIDVAKVRFPEDLALRYHLKPRQRAAVIAANLGWTHEKIGLAAGVDPSTVTKWLGTATAKEFARAVELYTGTRDVREAIDTEQYASVLTLRDLRDDPTVSAATRASIAQYFINMKLGKPGEGKGETAGGVSMRDLVTQLQSSAKSGKPTE